MRALGRRNLPDTIALDGVTWRHTRTHKHDFWAVTGFYETTDVAKPTFDVGLRIQRLDIPSAGPMRARLLFRR